MATVTYNRDAAGNRTRVTLNGADTLATYDAGNRLLTQGAAAYTHDNNGNRTSKAEGGATTTYAYDAADRLVGVAGPASVSYTYDGDGYRVGAKVGRAATAYTWDRLGAGGLGAVVGDGSAEYVWGPAGLQQRTAAGASRYAHGDGLGSLRLVTDAAGAAVSSATYEPWGAPRPGSATLSGFGFTGEQTDAETGFVYLRARHYDPATGQFVQQDTYAGTLPDPLSQHRYGYARGNPLAYTDPSGHDPLDRLADHEAAVRGACLAAGGQPAVCEGYALTLVKDILGDTGGATATDPFDPVSAFRDGSPVDQAICLVVNFGSGLAGIVRGGGKWAIRGLVTRQSIREAVAGLRLAEAQAAKVLDVMRRKTTSEVMDIMEGEGGDAIVRLTRPGRDGYQVFEHVIGRDGTRRSVVQRAYDANGNPVHIDPKK